MSIFTILVHDHSLMPDKEWYHSINVITSGFGMRQGAVKMRNPCIHCKINQADRLIELITIKFAFVI